MKRGTVYALICLIGVLFTGFQAQAFNISDLKWAEDVGARKTPDKTRQYLVSNYGAVADGLTMNTAAIQKAIDACAGNGGGIVTFDRGSYLTGSIYLKEGVHFQIPKGTTLLGSQDLKDYPTIDTRVAGVEMRWPSALINVLDQKNVLISGDGIVHAQGKVFWEKYRTMARDYNSRGLRWIVDYDCERPRTLLISRSSDITLKGITFQQAGFWTVQVLYSSYCTVDGIVVQNNLGGHGPSTDGIDIDSSSRILVENCDIDCNDDNFCLKAGRDADGLRVNRPTEYIVIRNCISRAGGGLFTCGSETSGGIRYVLAYGLKAKGTGVGIRLKSAMNRGGTVEHIYVKDIEMENVGIAFEATTNWNPAYSYSTLPKEYEGKVLPAHWVKMLERVSPEAGTPHFNNIYLSDFNIKQANRFVSATGSETSILKNFFFENLNVRAERAGRVAYAADWSVKNIRVRIKDNSEVDIQHSKNVEIPLNGAYAETQFLRRLTGLRDAKIQAADHPELAFNLPEMAGNLKFGLVVDGESKWIGDFEKKELKQTGNKITYTVSDPLLKKGELVFSLVSLSNTNGVVIELDNSNLPEKASLFWSYGGAYGKALTDTETPSLNPLYCKYNVFSLEHTSFTLYYGESMRLRTIQGVMPLTSEIRLADARVQDSPLALFGSGKDTDAPVLTALVPLSKAQKEYFCIYKQSRNSDYKYYMLSSLFEAEWKK
ncbi:DUF4450 domain-containing protein [Viscerimonas tarda]